MSLDPPAIRKMRFSQRWRGYDPEEVEQHLDLVAEDLSRSLADGERLRHEVEQLRRRVAETEGRERELQETLLRAQKVSDEILANAQREAQLLVKEAEITADRIVQQSIEQAGNVERAIGELRHRRRELQLKLKNTLDFFARILDSDMAEEREQRPASVRSLPRKDPQESAG
ncbi:MAG TPA: DivIVA domain-containing protein [Thermoanaerobaculia bacterium]|nr:DivIVA domain-containing protein [Thermoanaerobaculia bacterium]